VSNGLSRESVPEKLPRSLGGSVFAAPWSDGVVLTTSDGVAPEHTIYLNGGTLENLLKFIADAFQLRIEVTHVPSEREGYVGNNANTIPVDNS